MFSEEKDLILSDIGKGQKRRGHEANRKKAGFPDVKGLPRGKPTAWRTEIV